MNPETNPKRRKNTKDIDKSEKEHQRTQLTP